MSKIPTEVGTIEYHGCLITYQERDNNWLYTKGDRDRTAPSLAEAKRIIDLPEKADKPAFKRIEVWVKSDHQMWRGQVTGTAYCRYRSSMYWVSVPGSKNKKRFQASHTDIFPCNEKNDKLAERYNQLQQQHGAIWNEMTEIAHSKLVHIENHDASE